MIKSYLKSAIRNVLRQRIYGTVNIIGLAIGMASSLALAFWIIDEIGYDSFHENASNIQRVGRSRIRNGQLQMDGLSAAPVGPTLKERYPGVIDYCCTYWDSMTLGYATKSHVTSGLFVDPSFFEIFSFELEKGDPQAVLEAPNSIVLTQETATALFGTDDPIGKQLDNGLIVTGIVAKAPDKSSISFNFLVTNDYMVQIGEMTRDAWYEFGYQTFILLEDQADAAEIAASIQYLYKEIEPETSLELHLQPLLDIHLKPLGGGGRIVYIYIFSFVAILLLVVACINFVNLATARATQRAREIGTRKVIGATRWQLGLQVMLESIMQTTIAMILAISMLELALPMLTDFFGKEMTLDLSFEVVLTLAGICIVTGVVTGVYPALVLSSFRPAVSLRASGTASGRGSVGAIRKGLVVFQFAVSAGLIFSTLIINAQMEYIQRKDLGINRDNIVCVSTDGLDRDYKAFETELTAQPGIEIATAVFSPPAWSGISLTDFEFDGKGEDNGITACVAFADYNYADVFGLNILEGRNLSEEYSTDATDACLINESAARAMDMDDPVGQSLELEEGHKRTIVGVVKDFHFESLHSEVEPLIMGIDESWFRRLCIKLESDDVAAGLASVERTFGKFRPGQDFSYRFFDEFLTREYRLEARTKDITLAFTFITTIVAILGLLGLAATSIERRTKEIGIRKALGSTTAGIIKLVTSEFVILILIGNAIVAPLAYYVTSQWLENFAYRIELTWATFLLTALMTISAALSIISVKAFMAAKANPVEALKYE